MTTILVETDTAPILYSTISDQEGPLNLSGATVHFLLRRGNERRFRIDGECTIVDAATGRVRYQIQPDDLDFSGECEARFLVVFDDATRQHTVPPIPVTVQQR